MPYRIIPFVNDHFYHIYNRGVEKRTIFENRRDHDRFLKTLQYYQLAGPKPRFSKFFVNKSFKPELAEKIVEIIAYCLMPNHFHLLIKQLKDRGISEFLSKLSNSYTKYYNTKHTRVGPLLQGEFKAVLIESEEQLTHVSRYVHLNPYVSFLVKDLNFFEWSSYAEYIGKTSSRICDKEAVISLFKSPQDYEKFVLDHADYAQRLEIIKHQLIDENSA